MLQNLLSDLRHKSMVRTKSQCYIFPSGPYKIQPNKLTSVDIAPTEKRYEDHVQRVKTD